MFALPLALLVLAILGLSGMALLHRARLGLDPLEIVAYGVPLGWAGWSLVLLGIASLAGELTTLMVLVLTFTAGAVGFALWASTQPTSVRPAPAEAPQPVSDELPEAAPETPVARPAGSLGIVAAPAPTAGPVTWRLPGRDRIAWFARERISWRPVLVLGLFSLVWVVLWSRAVQYRDDGIFLGIYYLYSDFPLHLGDVASMVYGDNFPVMNPRFAGDRYPYHYLATLLSAALVTLGILPGHALAIGSALGFVFLAIGFYAFSRRIVRHGGAALLATTIYLFGGNLAWLLTAAKFDDAGFWAAIHDRAWQFAGPGNYDDNGLFYWDHVLVYPIVSQRAWTLGMPVLFLILTLLLVGLRQPAYRLRSFAAAGVVTGITPFVNMSTLLALALILPFLAFFARTGRGRELWPLKAWLVYGAVSAGIGLPLVLYQQGLDGQGPLQALRWEPGWILDVPSRGYSESWWWFWAKNLGFLAVAIVIGLLVARSLPRYGRVLVWSFMPLFVIANLIVFQPLDDDNLKLLAIWYVGGAIAAAIGITELWRRARTATLRVLITLLCASALVSGVLLHIGLLANEDVWQIANAEEEQLGEDIRQRTLPDGLFAVGQYHTNPILMLGGRPLMVGWSGQLWVHGYDVGQHEADLRTILQYGPDAEVLIARYGVDYVAISQREIDDYQANPDAYAARYPVALTGAGYTIFAVSPDAISLAVANGASLPTEETEVAPSSASPSEVTPASEAATASASAAEASTPAPGRDERPPRTRT